MDRPADNDCELFGEGFWGQPVNSATSFAFVLAGLAILAAGRGRGSARVTYGILTVATGLGSVIFHGPAPSWAGLPHDVPLVALVAFVGADAAADLAGRRLPAVWWVVPTLVVVVVSEVSEPARLAAQGSVAALAVGASLLRWYYRREFRRTILTSLVLLGTGALVGTLSRSGGPLCAPESVLQGHSAWHVLAALALWRLAPVIGRHTSSPG
ncbi:hypothetical protein [Phytoactinopolyspora endophytica]|uniref:hypothetical protein n=1 Tax=Phytoactinopolyspora endophytica TaxID=1642495 RepID=UPI0013EAA40D|nr:hypothetical protein [Phytoactinopolyspora endophytica]